MADTEHLRVEERTAAEAPAGWVYVLGGDDALPTGTWALRAAERPGATPAACRHADLTLKKPAHRADVRHMSHILRPALSLMGRLRFAQKFALIGLVLVAALAFTGRAYLRSQDGQIAFSAKERVGLRVVAPAGTLLGRLTALRSTAVRAAGGDDAAREALPERQAGVADARKTVDRAIAADGAALGLEKRWRDLGAAIQDAPEVGGDPAATSKAYAALTDGASALIVEAGNASNLILDPDLDSYYVMDDVITKVPGTLTGIAATSDLRVRVASGDDAARIDLAVAQGALHAASAAGSAGLGTAFEATADGDLVKDLGALNSEAGGAVTGLGKAFDRIARGGAAGSDPGTDEAIADATRLQEALAPALDRLLVSRLDRLRGEKRTVVTSPCWPSCSAPTCFSRSTPASSAR